MQKVPAMRCLVVPCRLFRSITHVAGGMPRMYRNAVEANMQSHYSMQLYGTSAVPFKL